MSMKIKLDDKGNAVLTPEGLVVFVDTNGQDIPVDVPGLYTKVEELNAESGKHRKQRNELRDRYKPLDGIEDVAKWKADADKALTTVKNLKDKELVDAGKIEQIKAETIAAKDTEIESIRAEFGAVIAEKDKALEAAAVQIRDLMVSSRFRQHPYFVGVGDQSPRTLLLPDIAESYFGKHFKVEPGKDGKPTVIGYDAAGKQIFSRKRPGELADFDEAIERIVNEYPQKDQILRGGKGGSGGEGGAGGGGRKTGIDAEIAKLEDAHKKASEAKDGRTAVALRNRLHDLKQKKAMGLTAV